MPRESLVIQTFDKGIISGADQADIPDGAAAWSVDEHPDSYPGTVQPRKNDTIYLDTNNTYGIEKHCWLTRADGKRDLVFYNATDFHIDAITDFNGSPSYSSTVGELTSARSLSFQVFNRTARMGWGDNPSKYIGYVDHGQFAGDAPSGIQYLNAACSPVNELPLLYSMFMDGTTMYGIEWQGKYIYKIDTSTSTYTRISGFTSLQGICAINGDSSNFYVYDYVGSYGVVIKLAKASLGIVLQADIDGFGDSSDTLGSYKASLVISDITTTSTYLFLQTYSTTANTHVGNIPIIFRVALASITANATITPSIFWTSKIDNTSSGDGYVSGTGDITIPKKGFVVTDATSVEIGLLCDIQMDVMHDNGTLQTTPGYSIVYFAHDNSYPFNTSYSHPLNVTNDTSFVQLETAALTLVYPSNIVVSDNCLVLVSDSDALIRYHDATTYYHDIASCDWPFNSAGPKWRTITLTSATTKALPSYFADYDGPYVCVGFDTTTFYIAMSQVRGGFIHCAYSAGWGTAYYHASPLSLSSEELASPVGVFSTTKRYFYKCSFIYDGYQESPLNIIPLKRTVSGATKSIRISTILYDTSVVSSRITDVKFYRAEAASSTTDNPDTLYRLIGSGSIDIGPSSGTLEGWGTYRKISFDDTGLYGPSYESETGIAETLPNNTIDYTISTSGMGYHFVGQGYNEELDKIENFVFRSKKNTPDIFDWSNDFCVLPSMPIALHFFKGLLYAFTNSTMYVIDVESFVLIGEYTGFGVQSDLAITSNENAMFFANSDYIFMHDGKTPIIISYPISRISSTVSGATSHQTLASGRTIQLAISPKYNSLIVAYYKYNVSYDTYTPMFVFHLTKNAWYYWNSTNVAGVPTTYITYNDGAKRSLLIDYLGVPYLSVHYGILKLCGSATDKTCDWYSKEINFGNNTSLKKTYFVMAEGSITSAYIGYNGTSPATSITLGSQIAASPTKYKTIQLRFTLGADKILKGITVIFRRMIGLR